MVSAPANRPSRTQPVRFLHAVIAQFPSSPLNVSMSQNQQEAVMASAVVAVFDQYNEAQSAANELLVAGFDKKEVQLSGEETSTAVAETAPERPRKGIKGYFQSLFGMDRPEENDILIYDEAVRHGN